MRAWRFITWTLLFLASMGGVAAAMFPLLTPIFLSNIWLNGFILLVFAGGVAYGLTCLLRITRSINALHSWNSDPQDLLKKIEWEVFTPSSFLHPVAEALKEPRRLSQNGKLFLQEFFGASFQTTHEGMRYLMGGLVFLGLLGTFWGLSLTIQAISEVISQLPTNDVSGVDFFKTFKKSLQSPLGGMGTAFGTSLFGIASSLILGFIDLQLGNAESRFLTELETLLDQMPSLLSSDAQEEFNKVGPYPEPYVEAIWGHIGEHLDKLQRTIQYMEKGRGQLHDSLSSLGEKLSRLTDQMHTEQTLLLKLAEGQLETDNHLKALLTELQARPFQESLKWQITQMDHLFNRLIQTFSEGQKEMMEGLGQELRILGKTVGKRSEKPLEGSF